MALVLEVGAGFDVAAGEQQVIDVGNVAALEPVAVHDGRRVHAHAHARDGHHCSCGVHLPRT